MSFLFRLYAIPFIAVGALIVIPFFAIYMGAVAGIAALTRDD